MSVQVKTPTKTQFEHHEIQCGDKDFPFRTLKESKDDTALKNESKFSQPWNRKRRYSQSYSRRDEATPAARRKRLKSSPYTRNMPALPNKFLNGGSIEDPLNLNSLNDSELGRILNSATPQTSPMPTPVRRQSVEVRFPLNITDPLNLNDSDEDADLEKLLKKKKQRHNRHKKKEDGHLFSPPKNMDKNLMEALKIDIEPESQDVSIKMTSTPREGLQKQRSVIDKIVSPVIPQTSPKVKKKRRTFSDGKPDPSSNVSKSLTLSETVCPTDKKTPPKHKHPKHHTSAKHTNKSMQQKKDPKFIYGNYNRYYGYRNPAAERDHRLACFEREWFEGKRVLDIGCNVGHLTLSLAREFLPSKIVGIDIDHKLILAARKNVRYYMSSDAMDASKFPVSNKINYGPIEAPPVGQTDVARFPNNALFMQGNFVLESDQLLELQREEYDTIMALSVTKWIHFNWGDDGLKRFFKRIYRQLKPGGKLILEPQPWSSYKKKKKLTDKIFENFQSIKLRPEQFIDYLLSRDVGFSTSNTVDVPVNYSKGFRRPILVFTKSETVQNSPLSEAGAHTPAPAVYASDMVPVTKCTEGNQTQQDGAPAVCVSDIVPVTKCTEGNLTQQDGAPAVCVSDIVPVTKCTEGNQTQQDGTQAVCVSDIVPVTKCTEGNQTQQDGAPAVCVSDIVPVTKCTEENQRQQHDGEQMDCISTPVLPSATSEQMDCISTPALPPATNDILEDSPSSECKDGICVLKP